ncbi:MAG: 2-oxoacid:acceptor oxidoreductase family protein [Candidatus Thermoplasmatota archaeon]|nr:2-oxoacid:acceptor oxidoreductase family protein [Candidatus Thermoplasmatota archaeon]
MYEVRFHGRGGQGAVTAAEILAVAAFSEGKYTQSFPVFGVERRGAPVAAFLRMDDKAIRARYQIYEPDAVIVLDPSLISVVDVSAGVKSDGVIIINTTKHPSDFNFDSKKVVTVDATGIALKNKLGSATNPIVNSTILGAYAKVMEIMGKKGKTGINALLDAVRYKSPAKKEENVAATKEAYETAKV